MEIDKNPSDYSKQNKHLMIGNREVNNRSWSGVNNKPLNYYDMVFFPSEIINEFNKYIIHKRSAVVG